ncbi:MAG: IS1380 family transposase, partial [Bacteroidales bacterium]|nr:IS1380 family transposase [Bacteroidales bacterium]
TITSDAGLLLLREADRQIRLLDALDDAIPDPRCPKRIIHPQRTLLAQRVLGIPCGYEDLNDQNVLRSDALWQVVTDHPGCERDPDLGLGSAPTLCRMENRMDRQTLVRMAAILVDQFLSSYPVPPSQITLDFDATDDPVHGHQERRFFHGYYDAYCFLPLYVFCESQLLVAYLRPSDISGDHHTAAVLKLLVNRIRAAWPNVRITIRGDSGL